MPEQDIREGCDFCLPNGKMPEDRILFKIDAAYVIRPRGHAIGRFLIIPGVHCEELDELPATWMSELNECDKALRTQGLLAPERNITINLGKLAGQTFPHLHFWAIDRSTPDLPSSDTGLAGLIDKVNRQ
jgi:diadenosine tetraphosphate (Ap4A) HIT family hydrolase